MNRRTGFTLVELMIVVGIGALILLAVVPLAGQVIAYLQRAKVKQQLNTETRVAMDTMVQTVRKGLAASVARCSCTVPEQTCQSAACGTSSAPSSNIPFSHLDFVAQDNATHSFYWTGNTLAMDVYLNGATTPSIHQTLASNVAGLTFGGNVQDPAVIGISLLLSASGGGSAQAQAVVSNRVVHMVATP